MCCICIYFYFVCRVSFEKRNSVISVFGAGYVRDSLLFCASLDFVASSFPKFAFFMTSRPCLAKRKVERISLCETCVFSLVEFTIDAASCVCKLRK